MKAHTQAPTYPTKRGQLEFAKNPRKMAFFIHLPTNARKTGGDVATAVLIGYDELARNRSTTGLGLASARARHDAHSAS